MKILELNFSGEWRGGERQTLLNMKGLQQRNHQVFLLCRKNSSLNQMAGQAGFSCFTFSNIFGAFWFLITHARRFDLLHAQTAHILTYCVISKPFHQKKIVYTRRVNFIQSGVFTKIKYRFTDKLVAISTSVQQNLSSFTRRNDVVKISDIVIKENNAQGIAAQIAQLNPGQKKIIGIVAALTYEKQPLVCLNAIQQLRHQHHDFICLHFGDGPLLKEMQEKITAMGMSDYYRLIGFRQDALSWFEYFNVFIMPSLNEGLGSSVLDAYINKVPVVSSTCGGLADIVSEEKAMVCHQPTAEEFCEKTAALFNTPGLAGPLTDHAFRFVVHYHSMDYITNQYEQLFNELLQ